MNPIWLKKQVLQFYVAAVVIIESEFGLRVKSRCRNQPKKSKLHSIVFV